MLVAGAQHVYAGDDEECGEDIEDPGESFEQGGAKGDEDATEHQGTEYAKKEHAVLVFAGYCEAGEDECPDEDVVDGE